MLPEINDSLNALKSQGWTVQMSKSILKIPDFYLNRYPWIPSEVKDFFCQIELVCDATQTTWFLSCADLCGKTESSFAWNEWELESLVVANGDSEWVKSITDFWDNHAPLVLSVADGYSYYAIRRDGVIVFGREPEFEETEDCAASLVEFLSALASRPNAIFVSK